MRRSPHIIWLLFAMGLFLIFGSACMTNKAAEIDDLIAHLQDEGFEVNMPDFGGYSSFMDPSKGMKVGFGANQIELRTVEIDDAIIAIYRFKNDTGAKKMYSEFTEQMADMQNMFDTLELICHKNFVLMIMGTKSGPTPPDQSQSESTKDITQLQVAIRNFQ